MRAQTWRLYYEKIKRANLILPEKYYQNIGTPLKRNLFNTRLIYRFVVSGLMSKKVSGFTETDITSYINSIRTSLINKIMEEICKTNAEKYGIH